MNMLRKGQVPAIPINDMLLQRGFNCEPLRHRRLPECRDMRGSIENLDTCDPVLVDDLARTDPWPEALRDNLAFLATRDHLDPPRRSSHTTTLITAPYRAILIDYRVLAIHTKPSAHKPRSRQGGGNKSLTARLHLRSESEAELRSSTARRGVATFFLRHCGPQLRSQSARAPFANCDARYCRPDRLVLESPCSVFQSYHFSVAPPGPVKVAGDKPLSTSA